MSQETENGGLGPQAAHQEHADPAIACRSCGKLIDQRKSWPQHLVQALVAGEVWVCCDDCIEAHEEMLAQSGRDGGPTLH